MKRLSMADKLSLNKFIVDEGEPHIIVNNAICSECKDRWCLFVCPAELFSERTNGEITVEWAGCLECGTCRAVCKKSAVEWRYPNGGYGIVYRQG